MPRIQMPPEKPGLPGDHVKGRITAIVYGVILLVAIFSTIYTIPAGSRGLILTFGKASDHVYGPGIHMKAPFIQRVIKTDVRTQLYEATASSASKDLQIVTTQVGVNFHVIPAQVVSLYTQVGTNYEEIVIKPAIQEVVKASTAKFSAEELITKRELVKQTIEEGLRERMSTRELQIEQISITDFDFSPTFNVAIEAKVKAEQEALQAKNVLEQRKYEAEQVVVTARAQAEAIKISAEAINSKGGADYVKLQAINKWNGLLPNIMLGNGAMPLLDLGNLNTQAGK